MEELHESYDEFRLFEIGDASSKPFKVNGPSPRQVLKDMIKAQGDRTSDDGWIDPDVVSTWTFTGDKGTDYEIEIAWTTKKKMGRPKRFIKNPKTYRKYEFRMNIGFYAKTNPRMGTEFDIHGDLDDKERTTNLNEQYRVLATVVDLALLVINEITKEFSIDSIYVIPKADRDEAETIGNKRGRFYLAYLKKQLKKIKDPVTVEEDKFYGGFVIKGGHIHGGNSLRSAMPRFRND